MNILLLGGTGFFGSYIHKCLKTLGNVDFTFANEKNENGIQYLIGKTNLEKTISKKYDIVINNVNPINLSYQQTLVGIEEIVSFCKSRNSKLIQISSVSASNKNRLTNNYNLKKAIVDDYIQTEIPNKNYTILRFTQLFDYAGLFQVSQTGLYYLLSQIKKNNAIEIFSNSRECVRNYMPIEFAIEAIEVAITYNLTGVFNAHFDTFTLSYNNLIDQLLLLNEGYQTSQMKKTKKNGSVYFLGKQSDELISKMTIPNNLEYYFRKTYNSI